MVTHDFPTSNVVRTDWNDSVKPILGDRNRIVCKTGKNEEMGIPTIAIIKIPFETFTFGLFVFETRERRKLPKINEKHKYNNAWLIIVKTSMIISFFSSRI